MTGTRRGVSSDTRIMRRRRAARVAIGSLATSVCLAGALLGIALQPTTANHFGYALLGSHGLPSRLFYAGRIYANDQTCAGGAWCRNSGPPRCITAAWLRGYDYWPLQRIGSVPTLFGAPHALLRTPTPHGMTTMGLYVPVSRVCYLAYSLEGGP